MDPDAEVLTSPSIIGESAVKEALGRHADHHDGELSEDSYEEESEEGESEEEKSEEEEDSEEQQEEDVTSSDVYARIHALRGSNNEPADKTPRKIEPETDAAITAITRAGFMNEPAIKTSRKVEPRMDSVAITSELRAQVMTLNSRAEDPIAEEKLKPSEHPPPTDRNDAPRTAQNEKIPETTATPDAEMIRPSHVGLTAGASGFRL